MVPEEPMISARKGSEIKGIDMGINGSLSQFIE
jgi:hypothetical protein